MLLEHYKGRRVFITGHTGFKGAWLSAILLEAGAELTGYALAPPTDPALFNIIGLEKRMPSFIGDIRDRDSVKKAFCVADPEIVIHMAAQPLVKKGYCNPADTYEINVMGTVNILECIRACDTVRSFLNVTTDKVYENLEWSWGYRETDRLNGLDPYSNSKSCSELATQSYRSSFFHNRALAISTARAGNVIGGGDFAAGRIIPDCIRAAERGEKIIVRNPHSTRPYQHVLEALFAYLLIADEQIRNDRIAGCYNIGPNDEDCVETQALVSLFCDQWQNGATWGSTPDSSFKEANFLKLDCSLIKSTLGWSPKWSIADAVNQTVEWTTGWMHGENPLTIMIRQIQKYKALI